MECKYFGECGSCTLYDLSYEEQLSYKIEIAKEILKFDNPSIIRSPKEHFRNRAEFRIWHEGEELFYAMHRLQKKELLSIESCQIVSKEIYSLMSLLLDFIKSSDLLKNRLFSIEFLSSTSKNLLVTLIYHKKIDEKWKEKAKEIEDKFKIKVVGRSRGVKIVVSDDYIDESLQILSKEYQFRLYESGFIQPNLSVNIKMIEWVIENLSENRSHLLELYCGHGNFTIPLSFYFDRVLATEISKASIRSALFHKEINKAKNIEFARVSSEELVEALKGVREFRRLEHIDLGSYKFSHIFVDPPRAGLDFKTLDFVKDFENIIYISCNVETLKRDLELLETTHDVVKSAFFDQFAYTRHLESGVILQKKSL